MTSAPTTVSGPGRPAPDGRQACLRADVLRKNVYIAHQKSANQQLAIIEKGVRANARQTEKIEERRAADRRGRVGTWQRVGLWVVLIALTSVVGVLTTRASPTGASPPRRESTRSRPLTP